MPRSSTLHGSAPDNSPYALLVLDLISDFEFEDGARMLRNALLLAPRIAALKQRLKRAGVPTIYVNDNLGRWRSDRTQLIAHCLRENSRSRQLVEQLAPQSDDYFIMKPKHSGFFSTPLHALLRNIGARTLILSGVTSHQCVLFTAVDAYVREYELIIPRDCIAAMRTRQTRIALDIFRTALKAQTPLASAVRLRSRRAGSSSQKRRLER
jgi:nicotinamidase-related amidase